MKKIIDVLTKEEVHFTKADVPVLIHGVEHSGASLISMTIVSLLHKAGNKLCIFTAYSMAREEFLNQIEDEENVFYLEDEKNIEESLKFQTIFVQSGNVDLFCKLVAVIPHNDERIIFVKNIETINIPVLELVFSHPFIISGDLDLNKAQMEFKNLVYATKILLSPLAGEANPNLEKYQAFMKNNFGEKIIIVN